MSFSLSSTRWRIKGKVPLTRPRIKIYSGSADRDFLKTIKIPTPIPNNRAIVDFINQNPLSLKNVAQFSLDMNRQVINDYTVYQKDPKTWDIDTKRSIISQSSLDGNRGHAIYTSTSEYNPRSGMASSFSAALHQISAFPAGGGFLIPKDIYLEGIASGRAKNGFPVEEISKNFPRIQEYNAERYSKNTSIKDEIAILGKNPVRIVNHEIFNLKGAIVQILRPITCENHIFNYGHAIWILTEIPELPNVTIHNYIGHGVSGTPLPMLGDLLNIGSGVPTFKDVFSAGTISWYKFPELIELHGENAKFLALDPEVALTLDKYYLDSDPRLVCDRKILTLLDNLPFADLMRIFNPYTPTRCFRGFTHLSTPAPLASGECDITEIDSEEFFDAIQKESPETIEDFQRILEKFPSSSTGREEIVQKDGMPYTMTVFNEVLSIDPEKDLFHQEPDSLVGEPIDSQIADQIKRLVEESVDWDHIDTSTQQSIQDNIKSLVEATSSFSDGSSIEAILNRFNTEEFQQKIYDGLLTTLSESLEPHSTFFYNSVMQDPLFKDASVELKTMMKAYPFQEGVARQLFLSMRTIQQSGSSYLEAHMKSSLIREKQIFLEQPQNKENIQKEIAKKIKELGDVSTLEPDLAKTKSEIEKTRSDLSDIQERLLKTPDDKQLIDEKKELEKQIQEELDQEEALEEKRAMQDELNRAQSEMDQDTLQNESKDADREAKEAGEKTFEKPARV